MNKLIDLNKRRNQLGNIGAIDFLIKYEQKKMATSLDDLMFIEDEVCTYCGVCPLLSIVIPAYNAKEYLEETVHLLLEARFYLEIIIIDDGSLDNTYELAKMLASNYDSIKTYTQVNSGAGVARNNALKYCSGKYLYFLDVDDKVSIVELFRAVAKGLRENADLIFLPYEILYVAANKIDKMYPADEELFRVGLRKKNLIDQKRNALGLTGFPWNRIVSRDLMLSEKIKFGTTPVHNDIRFHWHSICAATNIVFHDRITCTHRKFEGGSLSSDKGKKRFSVFAAIDETYESVLKYASFKFSLDIWDNIVSKLLAWNLKTINKELRSSFSSEVEDFADRRRWVSGVGVGNVGQAKVKPKISIVTVTWNILGVNADERGDNFSHFEKMLSSVAAQSYGRENIEHVVIDGDSSDGTKEILLRLKQQGVIDVLVSEPDSGIYNAMNKGICLASGEYFLYLNAHDKLSINAIEVLVKSLESCQIADYAFGNSITIDEDDRSIGEHVGNINRIYFGMPYCHQAALYSRKVLEKVRFPEEFRITTWKFALNVHLAGFQHVYVDDVIAFFRIGGVSTHDKSKKKFLGELRQIKMQISDMFKLPFVIYSECRQVAFEQPCKIKEFALKLDKSYFSKNKNFYDFVFKMLSFEGPLAVNMYDEYNIEDKYGSF